MRNDESPFEEVIRQAFANAYPNPERVGCPAKDALKALAEHRNLGSFELTEHMSHCSPCTQEVLEFRRSWEHLRKVRRLAFGAVLSAVAAAILLWVLIPIAGSRQHALGERTNKAPIIAVLDFHEGMLRGSEHLARNQVVSIKTNELRIVLAHGTATGTYAVAIQRPADVGQDLASFQGDATVGPDGSVTIRTNVDLSRFAPGEYVAVWRHDGSENYASFFISL